MKTINCFRRRTKAAYLCFPTYHHLSLPRVLIDHVDALQSRIGKKTAQRIILELKDKLKKGKQRYAGLSGSVN